MGIIKIEPECKMMLCRYIKSDQIDTDTGADTFGEMEEMALFGQ